MAKLQRWRRRSSAGEGSTTTTDEPEDSGPAEARADLDGEPEPDPDDETDETDDEVDAAAGLEPPVESPSGRATRARGFVRRAWPVALAQASHPRQAVVTALCVAAAAAISGRPPREAGAVLLTVLVGQVLLGWFNDLLDRRRDALLEIPGKPLADGRLEPGTVWYALVIGSLVLLPLSISTGNTAGICYLISIALAMVGHLVLRRGKWSWVAWALSFSLYPAYLSYGGWGGGAEGDPPTVGLTVLAALLGIGVHFLRAVWGLVADNEEGWTYLPLVLGLKLGATRLLALSTTYTLVVVVLMAVVGSRVGLRA